MVRGVKILCQNDIDIKKDIRHNGKFYELENPKTMIVYRIYNTKTKKSFIGQTLSYHKSKKTKEKKKFGAIKKFRKHYSKSKNNSTDCPLFYPALKDSESTDWFIQYLFVSDKKKEINEKEEEYIKKYKTDNPKYGYNILIGNHAPKNKNNYDKFLKKKITANKERAKNGKLKKVSHNIGLPANITYRKDCEGYFFQMKCGDNLINRLFSSSDNTKKERLQKAIKFKKHVETLNKKGIVLTNDALKRGKYEFKC
mgnify:CR=1 FL=1